MEKIQNPDANAQNANTAIAPAYEQFTLHNNNIPKKKTEDIKPIGGKKE